MVFSSVSFLFLFLPLVLCLYHLLFLPVTLGFKPLFWRRVSNLLLFLASLVFYFRGEQYLVWIIIVSTSVDYICGLLISRGWHNGKIRQLSSDGERSSLQKFALAGSIISNLLFLFFFKYFNFGVENYNQLVAGLGLREFQWQDAIYITLPLGISFYTFQSMSYTIDVYRGRVKATRNFIDFACYVTMFPQLVAGPIVRYRDIGQQLITRMVTISGFASGINRFVLGLGKKVLIANTLSVPADAVFALSPSDLTPGLAWLGVMCYTFQIYFDFSGYSDMAIGLGRMFGFNYLENFNYPYIARSIQDFWRRWHISLSTWFRDYLYIPLGGNRKSAARTYFNLITVFFLCGLWHGASWTFVCWGLFHGLFLIIERWGLGRFLNSKSSLVSHCYTILVVVVGWTLFRSETFSQAMTFFVTMAGISGNSSIVEATQYLTNDVIIALVLGVIFSTPAYQVFHSRLNNLLYSSGTKIGQALAFQGARIVVITLLLGVCTMWLASGTHNPFIYFRF